MSGCSRSGSTTAGGTSTTAKASGASGAPANGQFGSITTPVCGKAPSASSTGTNGSADTGATTGPNVLGVTPSSIRIGTISDVGYSGYPGLNQELYDASDVFVAWCNSLGGINGHKIQLDHLDAKLFEYQQVIQTACGQDFSLVGGGGVFDSTGQKDRLKCLLPDFPGYVVSPEARGSDLSVQATNGGSNTAVNFGLAHYLTQKFPQAGSAVGYITANTSTTIINKQQYQEAGATFGWKTVYDAQYNAVGEASWLPFAQAIKDKGVKGLYFVGSAINLAQLINSLAQINYKLAVAGRPAEHVRPAADQAGRDQPHHQPRLHQRRHHPVRGHRRPGHPAVRAALRHVPAQGPEDRVARAQRLRRVVALRPVGQGLRQRDHAPVRLRERHPHHLVRRRRAERPARTRRPRRCPRTASCRCWPAPTASASSNFEAQPRAVQLLTCRT